MVEASIPSYGLQIKQGTVKHVNTRPATTEGALKEKRCTTMVQTQRAAEDKAPSGGKSARCRRAGLQLGAEQGPCLQETSPGAQNRTQPSPGSAVRAGGGFAPNPARVTRALSSGPRLSLNPLCPFQRKVFVG